MRDTKATDELVGLEEQFWTGDAEFYRRHLTSDAVMVFADPVGAMTRDAIVASIGDSARWRDVRITDVRDLHVSSDAVLLTYFVSATRSESEPAYETRASSLYVRREGEWQLAFHQQSPANGA